MNERLTRIYEKLRREFYRTPTNILILIPFAIGIIFIIIFMVLNPQGYTENSHADFLISLTFFSWGLSGVPMIIKKESLRDTGITAVIMGLIMLVVGTGLALVPFIGPLLK